MSKKRRKILVQNRTSASNLYWLAGLAFGGLMMVLFYYLHKQSSGTLKRLEVEESTYSDSLRSYFFKSPAIEGAFNREIQENWIKSIKFKFHSAFDTPNPQINAENKRIFKEEIELQKQLLASLPLTSVNRAALSEATIRLVPETVTPSGMVSYQTGELLFGMIDFVTPEERRQTLLNEIHHLTVGYINKCKLDKNVGKQLYYPFINEHGEIDVNLMSALKNAIGQIEKKINDLEFLLKKTTLTIIEKDRLNNYLEAISNYQPQVMRYELSETEYLNKLLSKEINLSSDKKLKLKLPNGNLAYGRIHDQHEGKVIILYSLNEHVSKKALASTFIEDYRHKKATLTQFYPIIYKMRGEKFDEYDHLKEQASDIDELLTPEMKQVFGLEFKNYFDDYFERDIACVANTLYHLDRALKYNA